MSTTNDATTKKTVVRRTKKSDPSRHYVDNVKFQEAMLDYHTKCQEAIAQGLDTPRASDYIGECIMKVVARFSTGHTFVGYMFREDMVLYAIENCVKAIPNYDPTKYFNPHAYFSMITWRAFVRYIEEEKRVWYMKHKNMLQMLMHKDMMEVLSGGHDFIDGESYDGTSTMSTSEFLETSLTIVNDYEVKMVKKKEKKRLKAAENEDSTDL